jgi:hypothetical protein
LIAEVVGVVLRHGVARADSARAERRPMMCVAATSKPETGMSDDTAQRGPRDGSRINVNQEHEIRYWTKALGVSEDELRRAVGEVGVSADRVRQHLGKTSANKRPSNTH